MVSIGITHFFTVFYFSVGNAAFVSLLCKTENAGQYGRESLLQCSVKTGQDVADLQIRVVTWKKKGFSKALLVFQKGKITKQLQGYSFAAPSWSDRNMNVSLLISNTAVQHQGVYTCEVMTNSGGAKPSRTSLSVKAKYSVPAIISKPATITQNENGTLVCNSEGGYPEGQLRWFNERNESIESAEKDVTQTESGLFHLSSKLTLQRGSILPKYTCAVFNASGGKEEEVLFISDTHDILSGRTEDDDNQEGAAAASGTAAATRQTSTRDGGSEQWEKLDSLSNVVAPLVVIGSLVTGLLMLLLFYRLRAQRHHQGARTCESDVEEADYLEMNNKYQDRVA